MAEECGEIVFWTLRKKFVASSDEMPEHSSQVMYYSLAIGHHVGVIDCLNVAFRCPPVSYTHLTLPTTSRDDIEVVAGA